MEYQLIIIAPAVRIEIKSIRKLKKNRLKDQLPISINYNLCDMIIVASKFTKYTSNRFIARLSHYKCTNDVICGY